MNDIVYLSMFTEIFHPRTQCMICEIAPNTNCSMKIYEYLSNWLKQQCSIKKKKISFKIKVIFFEIYICLLYAMKPRYSNLFNFRFNSVCSLCVKKQILTWFYQIWQSDFLHKQNAPTNGIHKTLFFSFNKKKTTFTLKHTQLDFLFLLNYFFFFFCVVSSEKKPEKNSFMIFI